jgi:tetratricopeptide (TPR) repeat protein
VNRALEVDPGYAQGYDRRGYAYFLLGDFERAEVDLNQAQLRLTALSPQERAELHYHRALLFFEQGRFDSAVSEINEALLRVEIPAVRQAIEELQSTLIQQGVTGN